MSKKAHAIKPSNATAYSSNIPQTPFEQYAVSTFSTNMLHFREINPEYHSSNRHSSNRHSSNNQASFLAIRWINISRNKLFTIWYRYNKSETIDFSSSGLNLKGRVLQEDALGCCSLLALVLDPAWRNCSWYLNRRCRMLLAWVEISALFLGFNDLPRASTRWI